MKMAGFYVFLVLIFAAILLWPLLVADLLVWIHAALQGPGPAD